jgi:hypothetical protein
MLDYAVPQELILMSRPGVCSPANPGVGTDSGLKEKICFRAEIIYIPVPVARARVVDPDSLRSGPKQNKNFVKRFCFQTFQIKK